MEAPHRWPVEVEKWISMNLPKRLHDPQASSPAMGVSCAYLETRYMLTAPTAAARRWTTLLLLACGMWEWAGRWYLELSFRRVRALPKDSRMGFDCSTWHSQAQHATPPPSPPPPRREQYYRQAVVRIW